MAARKPTPPDYFRPSSLPMLERCPASGVLSKGAINDNSDAATLGTAFHEAMMLRASDPTTSDLQDEPGRSAMLKELAESFRVPVESLDRLAKGFVWSPAHVEGLKELTVEEPVEMDLGDGLCAKGTLDLSMIFDHPQRGLILEVVDYKTGSPWYGDEARYQRQLWCYALAKWRSLPEEKRAVLGGIMLSIAYVERGADGWTRLFVAEDKIPKLEQVIRSILERALKQYTLPEKDREYRRGDQCGFCRGRHRCPAYMRDVSLILQGDTKEVTLANAIPLYRAARDAKKLGREVSAAVISLLREEGEIQDDEGRTLKMHDRWRQPGINLDTVQAALKSAEVDAIKTGEILEFLEGRPKRQEQYTRLTEPKKKE